MKVKRLLIPVLVLGLILAVSAIAAAATYSDLNNAWAKSYLLDLSDRSFLEGYPDGTMRPNANITTCEALVFLSRFYTPSTAAKALIEEDYGATVKALVPSSFSWANDEIEICMAADILTKKELTSFVDTGLGKPIEKEILSLLLVRTLQMTSEADALASSTLSFTDADTITNFYRGHVAQLVAIGVIEGDNTNKFTPHLSVTRSVVAKMVSVSLDYLDAHGTTLLLSEYEGASRTSGIITALSSTSLSLKGEDGLIRLYTLDGVSPTVNGVSASISSAYVGCYATVTTSKGAVTQLAIVNKSNVAYYRGAVLRSVLTGSTYTLYFTNDATDKDLSFVVADNAKITQGGKTATISNLTRNTFAILRVENDKIVEVKAAGSTTVTVAGTISTLKLDTTVTLNVTDADGAKYSFALDIANLPTLTRGKTAITIDRMHVGDSVTLTVKNGEVTAIKVEGSESTLLAKLVSITQTEDGTTWQLAPTSGGSTKVLTLDANATAYKDSKSILLTEIGVGDTVEVTLYGSTIIEVELKSGGVSSTSVSGSVVLPLNTDKQITILSDGKLIYIDVSQCKSVLHVQTGTTLSVSKIEAGQQIEAYGTYTNSVTFQAVSLLVKD